MEGFADGVAEGEGDGRDGEGRAEEEPAELMPHGGPGVGVEVGSLQQGGFESGEAEEWDVQADREQACAEAGEGEEQQGFHGVAKEDERGGRAEAAEEGDDVAVLSILEAGDGAEDEGEHAAAGQAGDGLRAFAGVVEPGDFGEEGFGALELGGVAVFDDEEGAHGSGEGADGVGAGGVGEEKAEFEVALAEPVGGLVVGEDEERFKEGEAVEPSGRGEGDGVAGDSVEFNVEDDAGGEVAGEVVERGGGVGGERGGEGGVGGGAVGEDEEVAAQGVAGGDGELAEGEEFGLVAEGGEELAEGGAVEAVGRGDLGEQEGAGSESGDAGFEGAAGEDEAGLGEEQEGGEERADEESGGEGAGVLKPARPDVFRQVESD